MTIKDQLRDPETMQEARRIVTRYESHLEIENLTHYPTPKDDKLGQRLDSYMYDLDNDPVILARKIEIGRRSMQLAWAEELSSGSGYHLLKASRADSAVIAMIGRDIYGITDVTDNVVTLGEYGDAWTVGKAADVLQDDETVTYRMNGEEYAMTRVFLQATVTVLVLEKH